MTAQRPSRLIPSSCGSTWRTRAASGRAGSPDSGSRRVTWRVAERHLADVEPAVGGGEQRVVGPNPLDRMAGEGFAQFAAQRGRKRLTRADRVGQQRAAERPILGRAQ